MTSTEVLISAGLIVFIGIALVLLVWRLRAKGRTRYGQENVTESIELFQADMEPLLLKLDPPHDCNEAAVAMRKMRPRYAKMLKLANRYPESSTTHKQIFNRALKPILDRLSFATTERECFKNPGFKKAFDRFINAAQEQARDQE